MLEIEKKYVIEKKTFFSIYKDALIEGRLHSEFIDQIYLFKSNSKIAYNPTSKEFVVTVRNKDKSETIIVPVKSEQYQKKLQSFIDFEDIKMKDGLFFFKGTYRIRFINDKPIFTFKRKVKESKIGSFEFEETIETSNDAFFNVLDELQSRIIKIRHKINVESLIYEIDIYQDFDFITLEIEFKDENECNNFIPNFDFILDGTFKSELKNKKLAKILMKRGKEHDI